MPLPVEEGKKFSQAILVLGTILYNEQDLHAHLIFLDQLRKALYVPLLSLMVSQEKGTLLQSLDVLMAENQILKKRNKFDRALTNVLVTPEMPNGKQMSIICTNTNGLITYVSPGAEKLLGYQANELLGSATLSKIHNPAELLQRAKEIEAEIGRKVAPGLGVLIEKTMRSKGKEDTRIWSYVKKDNSLVTVQVSLKPLFDEKSIFGFVEVATEVEPQSLVPQQKEGTTPTPQHQQQPQQVSSPEPPSSPNQPTTFLTPSNDTSIGSLTDDQLVNSLLNGENFDMETLELLDNNWF